jgi:hypothetical protein
MPRFSPIVTKLLLNAGWTEGRVVPLAALHDDFTLHPAAETVLREFGGLHINHHDGSSESAPMNMDLLPNWAGGPDQVVGVATADGSALYPLGSAGNEHCDLYIDTAGRVYLCFDGLDFYAPSFDDALEVILLGHHPRVIEKQRQH